jgi:His-Xaa-Ser repeat protein HxsA
MKKRLFLIPSLLAAGFLTEEASSTPILTDADHGDDAKGGFFKKFQLDHKYTLAGHRSHSSHGSHRSHRSSNGGGGYNAAPAPNYQSTPPANVLPKSPAISPQPLPGNSQKFFDLVTKVQTALYAYGYYTGRLDGHMGPQTRAALSAFQRDFKLTITGTITPEVLDALHIVAQ